MDMGVEVRLIGRAADRMRCDKCGRFVSESGDDTIVVGGTSTYGHQMCPPVEPDTWCLECVRKAKPELYVSILNDIILV